MYDEPGLIGEITKVLSSRGPCRGPAAAALFRMSRDIYVKEQMATNANLVKAMAKLLKDEPGTLHANQLLLCLQNVSFPGSTRLNLVNTANSAILDALAHVVSRPSDSAHKNPRNTAMAVMTNMSITVECKLALFNYKSSIICEHMIDIIEAGDEDENNVVAREKALTLCKNLANHPETKLPMYNFPRLIPALLKVINQESPKSKTHKEVALQVFQNLANNDKTPLMLLGYDGVFKAIVKVVSSDASDDTLTARTNAWLILQNISFITECREPLFRVQGCFDAINGVLDNKEDKVKKNALPVLLNIRYEGASTRYRRPRSMLTPAVAVAFSLQSRHQHQEGDVRPLDLHHLPHFHRQEGRGLTPRKSAFCSPKHCKPRLDQDAHVQVSRAA